MLEDQVQRAAARALIDRYFAAAVAGLGYVEEAGKLLALLLLLRVKEGPRGQLFELGVTRIKEYINEPTPAEGAPAWTQIPDGWIASADLAEDFNPWLAEVSFIWRQQGSALGFLRKSSARSGAKGNRCNNHSPGFHKNTIDCGPRSSNAIPDGT